VQKELRLEGLRVRSLSSQHKNIREGQGGGEVHVVLRRKPKARQSFPAGNIHPRTALTLGRGRAGEGHEGFRARVFGRGVTGAAWKRCWGDSWPWCDVEKPNDKSWVRRPAKRELKERGGAATT